MRPPCPALAIIAATLALSMSAAHAAESFDGCVGYITSLPAAITTQGTWCLDHDLATSQSSGDAITIAASNVTLDCNGFKIGGLAAGSGTATNGIVTLNRPNTTIRNCTIRGFLRGIWLDTYLNHGGHLIENNRLDGNTYTGINIEGSGSIVRRNQILHTGGSTLPDLNATYAIYTRYTVQVLDNLIEGVSRAGNATSVFGILMSQPQGGRIVGNSVNDVRLGAEGQEFYVFLYDAMGAVVRDNDLASWYSGISSGITCDNSTAIIRDNSMIGMTATISADGISNCPDAVGNIAY